MRFLAITALVIATFGAHAQTEINTQVCIYGGTSAGIAAAIAASETADVVLVAPRRHLGGMMTGGLGYTDYGNRYIIGGMSREFFERNGARYDRDIEWHMEPHVAEEIFMQWLDDAGVEIHTQQRLRGIVKEGATISSAMFDDLDVTADIFIDATYEGDLMAMAGVSYTWGREGRDVYGESLAGKREYSPKHQFYTCVDPYDADGNLLPLIKEPDGLEPGDGDKKVQAYNFRLCLTKDKDNQAPYPKPDNYDPARYEILQRYLQAEPDLTYGDVVSIRYVPNGKTDINNNGPVSTDHIGASWDYPEADYDERDAIWKDHEEYVKGFFYFLANDPSVPDKLQAEVNEWGLAKDEFVDNDHWPYHLYVREARRMVGEYVVIQKDLQDERTKTDSIGMGSYNSDSHNVQRFPVQGAPELPADQWCTLNEGDMQVSVQPYEIPYRALLPKKSECENLFVVCAVSASHVAYSSIRMEPQFMIMGQAAGVGASLSLAHDVAVQDVPVDELRGKLRHDGAVLSFADAYAPHYQVSEFPGVVVDNPGATTIGPWRGSGSVEGFVGYDYIHATDDPPDNAKIIYTLTAPGSGAFELGVSYSANPNRASNTPITITVNGTSETIRINQKKKPDHPPFLEIKELVLNQGDTVTVEIGVQGADGYVIADAVQLVPFT